MDTQVERIALSAKVISSSQEHSHNKMVAASSGSTVWLWVVSDDGESRQIGQFLPNMLLPVECMYLQGIILFISSLIPFTGII